MKLLRAIPFAADNKDYDVRIYQDSKLINFLVFRNNYPANGIRHQIKLSKDTDIEKLLNSDFINYFVDLVKREITDNIWQQVIG